MQLQDEVRRAAETEYALVDPQYTRAIRYGTFYRHPDFPDRYDANQLCRVSCTAAQTQDMVRELDREVGDSGLDFRKVSGYDPAVWDHLGATLEGAGWSVWETSIMLLRRASVRERNSSLVVRSVSAVSRDLEQLYQTEGETDRGFELARSQFSRVGGEYLVGYLDSKPACCTGWFTFNGVARFRHVLTAPWARDLGCATTLILHVQSHPDVRAQDELVIMVTPEGPERLYRDLGFETVAPFWEAKITVPAAS